MTHPLKWYSIHVAKTRNLKTYDGMPVQSFADMLRLIKQTFEKEGLVGGAASLVFEKFFPLFAIHQLPKTTELWKSRWHAIENEVETAICKRKNVSVIEMGCGAGDLLMKGGEYAKARNIAFRGVGIDIDPHAIQFAQGRKRALGMADIDFRVGDVVKGTVQEDRKARPMKTYFKKYFGAPPDLVITEGVIEWLRPVQDQVLENIFSLDAEEYIFLVAAQKALASKAGRIITGIAKASGETVRGFTKDELESLIQKHARGLRMRTKVCGGDWYPESFYLVNVTK